MFDRSYRTRQIVVPYLRQAYREDAQRIVCRQHIKQRLPRGFGAFEVASGKVQQAQLKASVDQIGSQGQRSRDFVDGTIDHAEVGMRHAQQIKQLAVLRRQRNGILQQAKGLFVPIRPHRLQGKVLELVEVEWGTR